jgi:hypothetical protein
MSRRELALWRLLDLVRLFLPPQSVLYSTTVPRSLRQLLRCWRCWQMGVAEVVDHDVKCSEEGVLRSTMRSRFLSLGDRAASRLYCVDTFRSNFRRITHTKRLNVTLARS